MTVSKESHHIPRKREWQSPGLSTEPHSHPIPWPS